MHDLYNLRDRFVEELCEIGKQHQQNGGALPTQTIDLVDKLAHAVKCLDTVIENGGEEYSNNNSYRNSYDDGMSHDGGSYRDGGYSRGRGRNARRDSMGRYSSERGYSRNSEDMAAKLESMMQEAPNDQVKQELRNLADKMRNQ